MVRGLDYYTKTTFEFVHDGLGAQSGIGGGGRYDGLMAALGGQPLSGVGFGLGVDRTLLACRAEGVAPWSAARCEVFGVPLGEAAQRRLVVLAGAAAPGRGAGRPGLRRSRAEGRDEGGRPLRRPLRARAGRARPRRGHGRRSRTWCPGSSGRCRWTGSLDHLVARCGEVSPVPAAPCGLRARERAGDRRGPGALGRPARRRPGDVPLPPDALRGREDLLPRRAGPSTWRAGGARSRCGWRGAGWWWTRSTCRRWGWPPGGCGRPRSLPGPVVAATTSTPGCRTAAPAPTTSWSCQRFRDPALYPALARTTRAGRSAGGDGAVRGGRGAGAVPRRGPGELRAAFAALEVLVAPGGERRGRAWWPELRRRRAPRLATDGRRPRW